MTPSRAPSPAAAWWSTARTTGATAPPRARGRARPAGAGRLVPAGRRHRPARVPDPRRAARSAAGAARAQHGLLRRPAVPARSQRPGRRCGADRDHRARSARARPRPRQAHRPRRVQRRLRPGADRVRLAVPGRGDRRRVHRRPPVRVRDRHRRRQGHVRRRPPDGRPRPGGRRAPRPPALYRRGRVGPGQRQPCPAERPYRPLPRRRAHRRHRAHLPRRPARDPQRDQPRRGGGQHYRLDRPGTQQAMTARAEGIAADQISSRAPQSRSGPRPP